MLLTDNIEVLRIYWVKGTGAKHWEHPQGVFDPPCSGWQMAFVIRGEKRSTIFCPYTYQGYAVKNVCGELRAGREPTDFDLERFHKITLRNWHRWHSLGVQKDFDTAAVVFNKLGWEVPINLPASAKANAAAPAKKSGKTPAPTLTKPVKRKGKRGEFLAWLMAQKGLCSIREAMAQFSMSRSNALSYMFMLHRDHGIGYEVVGDSLAVLLPETCVCPFDEDDGDDSWLD